MVLRRYKGTWLICVTYNYSDLWFLVHILIINVKIHKNRHQGWVKLQSKDYSHG